MSEIEIIKSPHTVIVQPVTSRVEITTRGVAGAPGAQGPIGPAGGEHFIYNRNGVPAASWPIQHDLGRRVHVSIISDAGDEVDSDVHHNDLNNLTITFAQPFSGVAVIG